MSSPNYNLAAIKYLCANKVIVKQLQNNSKQCVAYINNYVCIEKINA